MGRYIIWCKNHPVATLIIIGVITLFFSVTMFRLEVDATVDGLIIKNSPEYEFYHDTKKEFISDIISVVFIRDKILFSEQKLKIIERAFYELESIPGVIRIDGIFNAKNFVWENGIINTDKLIIDVPEEHERERLDRIRTNAMKNPLVFRNLIAHDGSAIAFNVISDNTENEENFNLRVTREIEKILDKHLKDQVDEYFQIGTPYTRTQISKYVMDDVINLIPISVIVILVMLIIILQDIHGGIIPSIAGVLSLIWTLGFMPLLGIKLQILTSMAPSIIIALGCTFDVHFLTEYYEATEEGHFRGNAVDYIAPRKGLAMLLAGLSTLLGCISIIFNDITMLIEFGLVSFWGTLANFMLSCAIDPVYFHYFGPKKTPKPYRRDYAPNAIWTKLAELFSNFSINYKKATLTTVILIIIVFIYGSTLMKLDNDLLGYFKPNSPIRKRSSTCNQLISGAQVFYIILTAKEKGAFKEPDNIKIILEIQKFIKENKLFDFTISLADHIAYIEREMNEGKPEYYLIPDSRNLIAQHLLFYHADDLDRYVNYDYNKANIIVRHNIASSYELKRTLAKLDDHIKKTYQNHLDIRFTGENILFLKAADTMSSGLEQSVGFVILTVFIMVTYLYRNPWYGLLSIIPNIYPAILVYGFFGFMGIPLNVGTNMIANITIGVSVDDTIHLMSRYHQHYHKGITMEERNSIAKYVLKTEIRPMMVTSLALTVGFLLLAISDFIPVIYFGVFSAVVLFIAVYCDCIVTPCLLTFIKFGARRQMKGLD